MGLGLVWRSPGVERAGPEFCVSRLEAIRSFRARPNLSRTRKCSALSIWPIRPRRRVDSSNFRKFLRAEICSCGCAVLRLSPSSTRKAGEPRSACVGPLFSGKSLRGPKRRARASKLVVRENAAHRLCRSSCLPHRSQRAGYG